ncbi:MAG: hypothetical protein GY950_00110 [bacterium]|nr:hypothetical protein [bacterium]
MRIKFALLLAAAVTMLPAPLHENATKSTLKVGIHCFPDSLNPLYAMDETSQALVNKVFDPLFYYNPNGKLENGLVQNHHTTTDGKEIVLTLKKKIFFADRKELDAYDVAATIERVKDKNFHSPYFAKLKFIDRVEIIDKYTLKLVLNYKYATWKNHLVIRILNARQIAGKTPHEFRHAILSGTGAYHFHQVREPAKIMLRLNDARKNPSMYHDIQYHVVTDTQTAPLKLITGELDICELQPQQNETHRHSTQWQEKFTIIKYKKFGYTYLVFNLQNKKLTPNTRRIFYNLLVYGDFPRRFLQGKGECVSTPFLPLNGKTNVEKFAVTPVEKPLRLKILVNAESKIRKEFVLFLKNELKPFNIHLNPQFMEYHMFLSRIKKSNYEIALSGFLLDIDYDMKDIFYSDAYFNYANFHHPTMDRLLDAGLRETDPVKREGIYLKAHRVWLEELPMIPLFNLYYYVGVSKELKIPATVNTLVSSEGDFLSNIRQWTKQP